MTRKPYILIADDDQEDRYLLDIAFKEIASQENIRMVENGAQVIDYLNGIPEDHFLPNLIVLDLNMPKLSGIETLARLKTNHRFKDIPVIIHSTSMYEVEKEKCLEIGAADFIKKPVNFDQMVSTARLLQQYSMVV
jgi:Response regulator containing CheY-like receiver, AAA-type ATPase, and DNA-binding domains